MPKTVTHFATYRTSPTLGRRKGQLPHASQSIQLAYKGKHAMELSRIALEDIFQVAQKVHRGDITLTNGSDHLVRTHGLNVNSARMTIRSLRHLLDGERYRRALSLPVTDYALVRIRQEQGTQGLKKALIGLSAHIDYRHSTGVAVPGLQTILAKHSK